MVDGRSLRVDLRIPADAGPFPLVVWIHGGGWLRGNKRLTPNHPALRQLDRNYAVASIEYRLSGEATFPAQLHDCKAAIRWLRANAARYRLDPERIAVWGSSAGAHLAALLGTTGGDPAFEDASMGNPGVSSRVQAVIDWYGPTDFLRMGANHDKPDSPESRLLGCPIQSCPDRAAQANPITHVTPDDPPFFIQHGSADRTVPINQSELLHHALRSAGVPVTYVPLQGVGHKLSHFARNENLRRVEAFLDRVIGSQRIPPAMPSAQE
jgi:acetyl esterase/lipase